MNRLLWCAQLKHGIGLTEPSDNLAAAYLKKAEEALDAMHTVHAKDWKISTGYYSMYFSLYAVFMKIGIRSENHICSLEIMRQLLHQYFKADEIEKLKRAQKSRIECQYYTSQDVPDILSGELMKDVPLFLVRCKGIMNRLTERDIARLREDFKNQLSLQQGTA